VDDGPEKYKVLFGSFLRTDKQNGDPDCQGEREDADEEAAERGKLSDRKRDKVERFFQRVLERAYFLWRDGSHDEVDNYYAASSTEIGLLVDAGLDFHQRVLDRAYFYWLGGCTDERGNYFAALRVELELIW